MEITKRSLVLVFGTPVGKEETITITNPGESLEGSQIKAVMDTVLATGAVGEKSAVDSIEMCIRDRGYIISPKDIVFNGFARAIFHKGDMFMRSSMED